MHVQLRSDTCAQKTGKGHNSGAKQIAPVQTQRRREQWPPWRNSQVKTVVCTRWRMSSARRGERRASRSRFSRTRVRARVRTADCRSNNAWFPGRTRAPPHRSRRGTSAHSQVFDGAPSWATSWAAASTRPRSVCRTGETRRRTTAAPAATRTPGCPGAPAPAA